MASAPVLALLLVVTAVALCDADVGEASTFLQRFRKRLSVPPPPWLGASAVIEQPQGLKNMGSWTAVCFTEEQQARLGVDEKGNAVKRGMRLGRALRRNRGERVGGSSSPCIPKAQSEEEKISSKVADESVPAASGLKSDTNNAVVSVPLTATKVDVAGPGLQMGAAAHAGRGSDAGRSGLGPQLGSTFRYFDEDGSQSLNYPEQVALVMNLRDSMSIPLDLQKQVVKTVHAEDENNDMQLNPQEYRRWLVHLLQSSQDSSPDLPGILPSIADKICSNNECSGS